MNFLDSLLAKIPGNGFKRVIGSLLVAFPHVFPTLVEPANATLTAIGAVVFAIGQLHDSIKDLRK